MPPWLRDALIAILIAVTGSVSYGVLGMRDDIRDLAHTVHRHPDVEDNEHNADIRDLKAALVAEAEKLEHRIRELEQKYWILESTNNE